MGYYLAGISLLAVCLTVIDKHAARRGKRRIAERTLLWCGAAGGAAAEWIAMKLCRHKTKHKRFMIGLPLLTAAHVLLLGAWIVWKWMR